MPSLIGYNAPLQQDADQQQSLFSLLLQSMQGGNQGPVPLGGPISTAPPRPILGGPLTSPEPQPLPPAFFAPPGQQNPFAAFTPGDRRWGLHLRQPRPYQPHGAMPVPPDRFPGPSKIPSPRPQGGGPDAIAWR